MQEGVDFPKLPPGAVFEHWKPSVEDRFHGCAGPRVFSILNPHNPAERLVIG